MTEKPYREADKEGWKKFEFPPNSMQIEERDDKMHLTDSQYITELMNRLKVREKMAEAENDEYMAGLWKKWQNKTMYYRLKQSLNGEFIDDFILWLQGRSKWNAKTVPKIDMNKIDPQTNKYSIEYVPGTPWGNQPMFDVQGVSEFLDQAIDRRSDIVKRVAHLKNKNPKNLNELWIYYKYIVRQMAVDEDSIKDLDEFRDFDYPIDPQTGKPKPTQGYLPMRYDENLYKTNLEIIMHLAADPGTQMRAVNIFTQHWRLLPAQGDDPYRRLQQNYADIQVEYNQLELQHQQLTGAINQDFANIFAASANLPDVSKAQKDVKAEIDRIGQINDIEKQIEEIRDLKIAHNMKDAALFKKFQADVVGYKVAERREKILRLAEKLDETYDSMENMKFTLDSMVLSSTGEAVYIKTNSEPSDLTFDISALTEEDRQRVYMQYFMTHNKVASPGTHMLSSMPAQQQQQHQQQQKIKQKKEVSLDQQSLAALDNMVKAANKIQKIGNATNLPVDPILGDILAEIKTVNTNLKGTVATKLDGIVGGISSQTDQIIEVVKNTKKIVKGMDVMAKQTHRDLNTINDNIGVVDDNIFKTLKTINSHLVVGVPVTIKDHQDKIKAEVDNINITNTVKLDPNDFNASFESFGKALVEKLTEKNSPFLDVIGRSLQAAFPKLSNNSSIDLTDTNTAINQFTAEVKKLIPAMSAVNIPANILHEVKHNGLINTNLQQHIPGQVAMIDEKDTDKIADKVYEKIKEGKLVVEVEGGNKLEISNLQEAKNLLANLLNPAVNAVPAQAVNAQVNVIPPQAINLDLGQTPVKVVGNLQDIPINQAIKFDFNQKFPLSAQDVIDFGARQKVDVQKLIEFTNNNKTQVSLNELVDFTFSNKLPVDVTAMVNFFGNKKDVDISSYINPFVRPDSVFNVPIDKSQIKLQLQNGPIELDLSNYMKFKIGSQTYDYTTMLQNINDLYTDMTKRLTSTNTITENKLKMMEAEHQKTVTELESLKNAYNALSQENKNRLTQQNTDQVAKINTLVNALDGLPNKLIKALTERVKDVVENGDAYNGLKSTLQEVKREINTGEPQKGNTSGLESLLKERGILDQNTRNFFAENSDALNKLYNSVDLLSQKVQKMENGIDGTISPKVTELHEKNAEVRRDINNLTAVMGQLIKNESEFRPQVYGALTTLNKLAGNLEIMKTNTDTATLNLIKQQSTVIQENQENYKKLYEQLLAAEIVKLNKNIDEERNRLTAHAVQLVQQKNELQEVMNQQLANATAINNQLQEQLKKTQDSNNVGMAELTKANETISALKSKINLNEQESNFIKNRQESLNADLGKIQNTLTEIDNIDPVHLAHADIQTNNLVSNQFVLHEAKETLRTYHAQQELPYIPIQMATGGFEPVQDNAVIHQQMSYGQALAVNAGGTPAYSDISNKGQDAPSKEDIERIENWLEQNNDKPQQQQQQSSGNKGGPFDIDVTGGLQYIRNFLQAYAEPQQPLGDSTITTIEEALKGKNHELAAAGQPYKDYLELMSSYDQNPSIEDYQKYQGLSQSLAMSMIHFEVGNIINQKADQIRYDENPDSDRIIADVNTINSKIREYLTHLSKNEGLVELKKKEKMFWDLYDLLTITEKHATDDTGHKVIDDLYEDIVTLTNSMQVNYGGTETLDASTKRSYQDILNGLNSTKPAENIAALIQRLSKKGEYKKNNFFKTDFALDVANRIDRFGKNKAVGLLTMDEAMEIYTKTNDDKRNTLTQTLMKAKRSFETITNDTVKFLNRPELVEQARSAAVSGALYEVMGPKIYYDEYSGKGMGFMEAHDQKTKRDLMKKAFDQLMEERRERTDGYSRMMETDEVKSYTQKVEEKDERMVLREEDVKRHAQTRALKEMFNEYESRLAELNESMKDERRKVIKELQNMNVKVELINGKESEYIDKLRSMAQRGRENLSRDIQLLNNNQQNITEEMKIKYNSYNAVMNKINRLDEMERQVLMHKEAEQSIFAYSVYKYSQHVKEDSVLYKTAEDMYNAMATKLQNGDTARIESLYGIGVDIFSEINRFKLGGFYDKNGLAKVNKIKDEAIGVSAANYNEKSNIMQIMGHENLSQVYEARLSKAREELWLEMIDRMLNPIDPNRNPLRLTQVPHNEFSRQEKEEREKKEKERQKLELKMREDAARLQRNAEDQTTTAYSRTMMTRVATVGRFLQKLSKESPSFRNLADEAEAFNRGFAGVLKYDNDAYQKQVNTLYTNLKPVHNAVTKANNLKYKTYRMRLVELLTTPGSGTSYKGQIDFINNIYNYITQKSKFKVQRETKK